MLLSNKVESYLTRLHITLLRVMLLGRLTGDKNMEKIKIEQITVGSNRRKLGDFTELAKSINEVGLINPIQVNEQLSLIAGLHRLEACKSIGWEEIDARILTVDDITAELMEIDENLFRIDLTVLERGQQYKRRKDLYEGKFPQTKNGGSPGKAGGGKKAKTAESAILEAPAFVTDTATKTNQSERTVREDVQVATNISNEVQAIIKDLPVADNKSDLLKLSRLNEYAQGEIAMVLSKKNVETVDDAIKVLDKDFQAAQPKPSNRQRTRSMWMELIDKMGDFLFAAQTEATIDLVVDNFNERQRNVYFTNATRLRDRLNLWLEVLERQGAKNNEGAINKTNDES
jgi:ParB family chromosome partitioning protein